MTSTLDLQLQAREISDVSWFCTYSFVTFVTVSPEPYNLWTVGDKNMIPSNFKSFTNDRVILNVVHKMYAQ